MKNIFAIMKDFGLELPEEKAKEFEKAVNENYKTINDYENQKAKIESLDQKVKDSETAMSKLQKTIKTFEGVDVAALNKTIDDLKADNQKKDDDYNQKLADRDFNDLLKDNIQNAKGLNSKAIIANLDIETLKTSKNQQADISAALKALSESDDCKMLFGTVKQPAAQMNLIGGIGESGGSDSTTAQMRAIAGLPPVEEGKK